MFAVNEIARMLDTSATHVTRSNNTAIGWRMSSNVVRCSLKKKKKKKPQVPSSTRPFSYPLACSRFIAASYPLYPFCRESNDRPRHGPRCLLVFVSTQQLCIAVSLSKQRDERVRGEKEQCRYVTCLCPFGHREMDIVAPPPSSN